MHKTMQDDPSNDLNRTLLTKLKAKAVAASSFKESGTDVNAVVAVIKVNLFFLV